MVLWYNDAKTVAAVSSVAEEAARGLIGVRKHLLSYSISSPGKLYGFAWI